MAVEKEMVVVFRSSDADAEERAIAVRDVLLNASISAEIYDDSAPGVPEGAFEVRVPSEQQADAEQLVGGEQEFGQPDLSHDLDMVAIYSSNGTSAELEAMDIRSVLEAQGIPSLVVSATAFPNLGFEVQVPKARLEEAQQALAAAEEAGPPAAEAAEQQFEAGGGAGDSEELA